MMRYSLSGVRLDMSSSTDAPRSLDDIDLLDHTRLRPILGHVDLDIGTLHLTLAEPLWHRHECRPQTENYRPSKHFARYEASLGTLKPFRSRASASKFKGRAPVEKVGLLSTLTYDWVTDILKDSRKRCLQPEDIPLIPLDDSCDHSAQRFEFMWKQEVIRHGMEDASLKRVVYKFVRTRLFIHVGLLVASIVLGFLGPVIFVREILEFCESAEQPWWHGASWAAGLACCEFVRTIVFAASWGVATRTAIRLRSAMMTAVYKKLMHLPNLGDKSIGELINMFANDSTRIYEVVNTGPMLCAAPVVAVIAIVYAVVVLGPHALIGMLIFIMFYPAQYVLSRLMTHYRRQTLLATDQRVRLMNELLTYVKLIKMYAWEVPFSNTIAVIRAKEKHYLEMTSYAQSISNAFTPAIPVVAVIVTFLVHIALGHDLSPAQGFALVAVMVARVRPWLNTAREALRTWDEASVVWPRIKEVLSMNEMKIERPKPSNESVAIEISAASFGWRQSQRIEKLLQKRDRSVQLGEDSIPLIDCNRHSGLVDVNLIIERGALIGVCGPVGGGKSSLLAAVLGNMNAEMGHVSVDGTLAFVSQQAWIMNSTLRDNILFGEPFDDDLYCDVILNCALADDLKLLPAADLTEIGERGVNLSGGQRQRVALARALYANKDIYLLDDPLSAVDAHIGQEIFERCVRGILKEKTVIFVTHQLQYLNRCDKVVFMDSGRIVCYGRHKDLVATNSQYSDMIDTVQCHQTFESHSASFTSSFQAECNQQHVKTHQKRAVKETGSRFIAEKTEGNLRSGRLVECEKIETGAIPWGTYSTYLKLSGGYVFSCLVLLIFMVNISSTALSSLWLAHWLNSGVSNATRVKGNETETYLSVRAHPDLMFYQMIYGSFVLVIITTGLLRSFVFIKASLRASNLLHNLLFTRIFSCPMRFFDTTPIGRILDMFSRDLDETDSRLPASSEVLLQNMLTVSVSIVFIVCVVPLFIVPLVAFAVAVLFFTRLFRNALRHLKRLENVSRSPIYSHIAATLTGLNTVHAFRKEREFVSKFMILFDENASTLYLFRSAMRWIAVRLDLIAVCAQGTTAGLVVALRGVVPAPFAGLALAYANQLSGMTQQVVRLASEAEARFISAQRLCSHLTALESEVTEEESEQVPDDWPQHGAICFVDVKMRYRPLLPFALQGVTFEVKAQEKIGIVGRTGSGKSSLGACLFRLVEVEEGRIEVDGLDVKHIGLADLRSRLAVIPQEPVLFMGSVRYNLDPFGKYEDSVIWEALERTNMKEKVESLCNQLDSAVCENGDNFSVGERQLLCLARALVRRSKVLLMDEATAAIDSQTDALVQRTVREVFHDCTILTIAHRLNTVIQCDRILVMDSGKVVEFDTPSALLADRDSLFSSMMLTAERPQ